MSTSNNKSTKYYSSIQENMIADYLGWRVVSGSGARDLSPGDLISPSFLGECKTHMGQVTNVIFYKDFWDKICEEAQSRFKYPALFVDDGSQRLDHTWVVTFEHSVDLTKAELYDYPYKFQVNLSFNHEELDNIINLLTPAYTICKKPVCVFSWGNDKVALLRLDIFKEVALQ